ncbi:RNA-binding protein [Phlyctema vagabunda]|uniref:RNA-binding protein n=1 Tax=Phlyctema vagabunda TaxID=108571 RepID=A0ABR4PM82_9HELO
MADPVGEDGWLGLVDEASRVAGDLEQRVGVVELYKKALRAEPWSSKLWLAYCEWFWSLYTDCQTSDAGWPEDEQLVGQEIFSLALAMEAWQEGARSTQYRINDSHEIWNRWVSIELEQLAKSPNHAAINFIRTIFKERLQVPHAAWEETSQMFSTFVSKYDEASWEFTMVETTQLAKRSKELYERREPYELRLKQAIESGGKDAYESILREYLEWEVQQVISTRNKKPTKKNPGPSPPILCVALYERALSTKLGFEAIIWQDYINFLSIVNGPNGQPPTQSKLPSIRSVAERATSHCPWNGPLWARYVLSAETDGLSFSEIESIKHAATSAGVLDRDGMTAVLDVYATWCGYLRRRTISPDATDEDMDVAEVGLHSALESVQQWGERLYGKTEYKGDPEFRIERVLITYLTEKGSIEEARNIWRKLYSVRADSYEFWQQYYLWEMTVRPRNGNRLANSSIATNVLVQAVNRKTLDWPEKMIEVYIRHCSTYEDAQTLTKARDTVHRMNKGIVARREKEAAETAAAYAHLQPQIVVENPDEVEASTGATKRKREAATDEATGTTPKKVKSEQSHAELQDEHMKRDRENTTVLVSNLPAEVTQNKVRQWFKEYGHINSLVLRAEGEEEKTSSTALIEFKLVMEAQSALLRDGKYFERNLIRVEPATDMTLYVTNYPPTADEAYFRKLFKDCGEIFSFRWPSLKYNTKRRFCYISFRTRAAATAATQFDGQLLETGFKLVAKFSDPSQKKTREGATAEGREVHITGIDHSATEEELKVVFSKHGNVQRVNLLKNMAGKSKGAAFITFEKKEEAEASCELNGIKFKTQILKVELSNATNFKVTATTGTATSASPAPDADGDFVMSSGRTPDDPGQDQQVSRGPSHDEISRKRVVIMDIPDTINDARIRALAEPFGTIIQVVLWPMHSGAVIEFADAREAGRASLGLDGYEITPERKLRIGSFKELKQHPGEYRTDKLPEGPKSKPMSSNFVQPSAPIRRPKVGGRGGLGQKSGLGFSGAKAASSRAESSGNENGTENSKSKSNADFKKMFISGGQE